ncbi:Uncharacterised protein [uncultured archaeon]|nr:Uncharacterised protein [uncultured archaeon]
MKTNMRMVFLLTVLLLSVIISGCVRQDASTPIQNKTPVSTQIPLTQTKSDLNLGEIAVLPAMEATVMEANKTDNTFYSSGGQHINEVAGEGNVLIVADFWIKNTGNKTIRFTNTPFALRDNTGFKYDPILYAGYDGIGLLNDSYPNQTKRGKAVFRVPVEAHGLNFFLDYPDSFTGPDFGSLPIKVKSISWWPGR